MPRNFHFLHLYCRYTTVDKEKDDELKSKKTKVAEDRESDGNF